MSTRDLTGRRLLITAGPTWAPLDAVRHISNFSTGGTGLELARACAAAGADLTLLLGPGRVVPTAADRRALRIVDFETFDDLHALVRAAMRERCYAAILHLAAVADYRPASVAKEKTASGRSEWVIRLVPTPKIVDEIKPLDPDICLVKFKLEVGRTPEALLAIAGESRARSDADLIVANDRAMFTPTRHPAWILDADGVLAQTETRAELCDALIRLLAERAPIRAAPAEALG